MKKPLLEMKGITKRFPNVVANEQVDLELYPGELVRLMVGREVLLLFGKTKS